MYKYFLDYVIKTDSGDRVDVALDVEYLKWVAAGNTPLPAINLAQAKIKQKDVIRASFEAAANANVTVGGIVYQGGYEKAMRLDALNGWQNYLLNHWLFFTASITRQTP